MDPDCVLNAISMNRSIILFFKSFLLIISLPAAYGQENFTLNGYVKDKFSGETLIGANVYLQSDPANGTVTNTYGFYSITLPSGVQNVVFSYVGYQAYTEQINLTENKSLNIDLTS